MTSRKAPAVRARGRSSPLELDTETMRAMTAAAMERILRHLASLPVQPMHRLNGGKKLARSLAEPMPEAGAPFDELLRLLFDRVIPASLNTASPGYLAYIPGGGLFHAAVADLIADATNRYVGVFQAAPALVQLEANVIRWFAEMLGLGERAFGVLTTGGSLANLIAVVTARRTRLGTELARGVIYTSEESHHSIRKAALLAGFEPDQIVELPTDAGLRLDPEALRSRALADRASGKLPFLAVATAGSTSVGVVDDLDAIAGVASELGLWLHVDAAYGGFFALTERGKRAMKGIERADSVTLDPHKSLFLPYGTGCLVVRDRDALRRAHSVAASYMPPMQTEEDLADFSELSPELSREARGLRVWLPLKMHGAQVFRDELDEKLDLAAYAAKRLVDEHPGLELVAPPDLSLFAFRVVRPGLEGAALDKLNRKLAAKVNARQRVFVTGAVVRGRFAVRLCILSFRTHKEHVDLALEDIARALA